MKCTKCEKELLPSESKIFPLCEGCLNSINETIEKNKQEALEILDNLPNDFREALLNISEAHSIHKIITRGRQNELIIELHNREIEKLK